MASAFHPPNRPIPTGPFTAESAGSRDRPVGPAAKSGPKLSIERSTISLVLVDDNRLLCEGLAGLIREQSGLRILATCFDADEALRTIRETRPDVVLLDCGLESGDATVLAEVIRREGPETRVIMMGLLPLQEEIAELVRVGASAFLMKDASFDVLLTTILAVADGAEVLPSELTSSLFGQIARAAVRQSMPPALEAVRLTPRERQVIDLISEGLSNKEIASRLRVAVHTVKSHVHNVLEKLTLRTRLEVAAYSRIHSDRRPPTV